MSALARRRCAVVLLALAVTGAARTASAFCRTTTCEKCPFDDEGCPTGSVISWPAQCVSFSLHYAASTQVDFAKASRIVQTAFDAWQNADCPGGTGKPSIRLDPIFGAVACDLPEYNRRDANANIIMFRDDKWPYEASSNNVLALTTVTYSTLTGEIYDVDMEVNATQRLSVDDMVSPGRYDLQSIVTHEAGHFLGLGHSLNPNATMWARYMSGSESFRELDPDDVAGICNIMPPDREAAACDFAPRQGFSPECGIYPSGDAGHCAVAASGLRGGPARMVRSWLAWPAVAFVAQFCRARFRRRGRPRVSVERTGKCLVS